MARPASDVAFSSSLAPEVHHAGGSRAKAALALAALGVVYGDIGTSPLYALKECFAPEYGLDGHGAPTCSGVLSLIFWSLNFVVSLKYLTFILRADNRGEGGIMALLALLRPRREPSRARAVLIALGLFGAALLYGDGVITPAISVLGAVEGVSVAAPGLPAVGGAHHLVGHPGRAVPVPAPRHRPGRRGVRAGHDGLVRLASRVLGIGGIMRHPEVLARRQSVARGRFLHRATGCAASSSSARSCWW